MADEAARQRKLNPIYDALESYDPRRALKLCAKKDVANWHITKALKAIAHQKLKQNEDALNLCREIKAAVPTDPHLLSTTALTFHALNENEEVTGMYEAAVAKLPGNFDLENELFFCYIRDYNYLKQQQQASKLYKLFRDTRFLMWSALSMLMQIQDGGNPRLLGLAEKMVHKTISERLTEKEPNYNEVLLYITILKEQGKHEEGLAALEEWGPGAGRGAAAVDDEASLGADSAVCLRAEEVAALKAELLAGAGEAGLAAEAYAELLRPVPDAWDLHLKYLDCKLGPAPAPGGGGDEAPEDAARFWGPGRQAAGAIACLQMARPELRGPFLAEMELVRRAVLRLGPGADCPVGHEEEEGEGGGGGGGGGPGSCAAALAGLARAYFARFAPKLCCFSDLAGDRGALAVFLPPPQAAAAAAELLEQQRQLCDFFQTKIGESPEATANAWRALVESQDKKAGINALRRLICAVQLRRYLGVHNRMTDEELIAEVQFLVQQYEATLFLNEGAEGGQREVQHGDELVLVSAHVLGDLADRAEAAADAAAAAVAGEEGEEAAAAAAAAQHRRRAWARRAAAGALCRAALARSGCNPQLRIALAAACEALGAMQPALLALNKLEIKQVQLDSLSWLVLPGLRSCGFWEIAHKHCNLILGWHDRTIRDVSNGIREAYEKGNFMQATDMTDFQRRRLGRSLQLAEAKTETITYDLALGEAPLPGATAYLQSLASGLSPLSLPTGADALAALSCNHDFGAAVTYVHQGDPAARDAARRARRVAGVAARRALLGALLGALQGDTQKVPASLPKIEELLAEAGYVLPGEVGVEEIEVQLAETKMDGSRVKSPPCVERFQGAVFAAYLLGLRLLSELTQVFQASGGSVAASAVSELVCCMEKLSAQCQVIDSFLAEKNISFFGTSDASEEVLVYSERWIKGISFFAVEALPYLCIIFEKCIHFLPKRKKNKKKGKAAEILDTREIKDIKKLFKSMFEKFITMMVGICQSLSSAEEREPRDQNMILSTFLAAEIPLPFLFERQENQELLNCFLLKRDGLLMSHKASLGKLLGVIKLKLGALQALPL